MDVKSLRGLLARATAIWLMLCVPAPAGADPVPRKQVLLLVSHQYGLTVPDSFARGALGALKDKGVSADDIYVEYLDLLRNRTPAYRLQLAALLREKLAHSQIGLIVVQTTPAVKFLEEEGRDLFPDVPLLINHASNGIDWKGAPRQLLVVSSSMDFAGTLRHALTLFPHTRHVLVALGRDADSRIGNAQEARAALAPFASRLSIEYTQDLSYEDMLKRVVNLPPDTVILNPTYTADRLGNSFVPAEVSARIAAIANAPAFVMYDNLVGNGVVGGSVLKSDVTGALLGTLAADVLAQRYHLVGEHTFIPVPHVPMFDWKQLERWNAEVDHLPPGTLLINKPPTLWGQYKAFVLVVAALLLMLSALVVLLLHQNRLRKAAELAARESEERFRVLVEHAPEAILLFDIDRGALVNANSKAARFSAQARSAMLSRRLPASAADGDSTPMALEIEQALAGGEIKFEKTMRMDDATRDWEVRIVRLPAAHQRLLRASFVDITERRQAQEAISRLNSELEDRVKARTADLQLAMEQLRQFQKELVQAEKLAALGAMVAGVAHELNTPIGNCLLAVTTQRDNLQLMARALKEGIKRSSLERFLQESGDMLHIVERNVSRASELVSSFKQVAVDRATSQRRRFQLAEVCRETLLTIGSKLHGNDYDIVLTLPDDIELDSYPGPLGQILANLIGNSIVNGFNERGHGRIDIAASRHEDGVRIQVGDDGVGIPAELQERIFDPFFTTRMGRGTGLGLHIVHNLLVGLLGGRISFVSAVGKGTVFTIEVPCVAPLAVSTVEAM